MFLEERLNVALVLSDVVAGDELEDVQHPRVNVVRVSEELVEVHAVRQTLLARVHERDELAPARGHLCNTLLDVGGTKVALLNQIRATANGNLIIY